MRIQPSKGASRFAALIAPFVCFAAATCLAQTNTTIGLNGRAFGNGLPINVQSSGSVSPSKAYHYSIEGTCTGTGDLAFIKPGTRIADFLNQISTGSGNALAGILPNPSGRLPVNPLIRRSISGTRAVPVLGDVKFSLNLAGRIDATGKIFFSVRDVSISTATGPVNGTIRFLTGARLVVHVAPEFRFNNPSQNIDERAGQVIVKVRRWGYVNVPTSVRYATSDGTAVSGRDYTARSGTLTFARGQLEKAISIPIIDNSTKDGKRTFSVTLSSPARGSAVGVPASTAINIINDDLFANPQ